MLHARQHLNFVAVKVYNKYPSPSVYHHHQCHVLLFAFLETPCDQETCPLNVNNNNDNNQPRRLYSCLSALLFLMPSSLFLLMPSSLFHRLLSSFAQRGLCEHVIDNLCKPNWTQSSHLVDRAGWQAKMASCEFWIPCHNALMQAHCKGLQQWHQQVE